jgi:hypothetical protein
MPQPIVGIIEGDQNGGGTLKRCYTREKITQQATPVMEKSLLHHPVKPSPSLGRWRKEEFNYKRALQNAKRQNEGKRS